MIEENAKDDDAQPEKIDSAVAAADEGEKLWVSTWERLLREAVSIVRENRGPGEYDDTSDWVQFQTENAVEAYIRSGGGELGRLLLDIVIKRYPFSPLPRYFAGQILAREGDLAAISYLESAMQLDPWHYRIYAAHGRRLLRNLGRLEEAREYWNRVRRLYGPIVTHREG